MRSTTDGGCSVGRSPPSTVRAAPIRLGLADIATMSGFAATMARTADRVFTSAVHDGSAAYRLGPASALPSDTEYLYRWAPLIGNLRRDH